ncbi:hypothetical protein QEH56_13715 [Pelagicoccus enzymogenes]|uniref:hypothetical protein n=1 Tax=Pelagicoccus enzymogenes TaxID=2773457 RepID=UPI00280F6CF6|nr:hypothetical protein [Pelagicoccus enzymogenes]MDQ8199221.1 hypothetical protein [Pelagicoccus enzymogenes]
MKLLEQTTLYLRIYSKIELYQVDLCDCGDGEYVVNYRQGRLDTVYRENTATVFPVDQARAREIYGNLVAQYRRKGYVSEIPNMENEEAQATEQSVDESVDELDSPRDTKADSLRTQRVLDYLRSAAQGMPLPSTWKLSRIVWRAGELRLAEAVSDLLKIGIRGIDLQDYSVVWALARLQSPDAVSLFESLRSKEAFPEAPISRLATIGLLEEASVEKKTALRSELEGAFNADLRNALAMDTPEEMALAFTGVGDRSDPPHLFLFHLYLLSFENSKLRKALLLHLSQCKLEAGYFKPIRWIFKAAELRDDADFYALLAYRFETVPHCFSMPEWGDYVYHKGQFYKSGKKELTSPNSKLAFSNKTRNYLLIRVARYFRRLGEAALADSFVSSAASFLKRFDDAYDFREASTHSHVDYSVGWRNPVTVTFQYDGNARLCAFNYLLYSNSSKYEALQGGLKWRVKPGFSDGEEFEKERGEAYPELWNRAPARVIELLCEAKSERVHRFARNVFLANEDAFCRKVETRDLLNWLKSSYASTQELSFQIIEKKFTAESVESELALALVNSSFGPAQELAFKWVNELPEKFLKDSRFASGIITASNRTVREQAKTLFEKYPLSGDDWDIVITRVLAASLAFDSQEQSVNEIVRSVGDTLLAVCQERLATVHLSVIEDLLSHLSPDLHILAGRILSIHSIVPDAYPAGLLEKALNSPHPEARRLAVELFNRFSEEELMKRQDIVASFCLSEHPEIRAAVRSIVAKLAEQSPAFGEALTQSYYPLLLRKERRVGMHEDLLNILRGPLEGFLKTIPIEYSLRMLESKHRAGQELGWELLSRFVDLDKLSNSQLAKLANCELLTVREAAQRWFAQNVGRVKADLDTMLSIVDSDWDDTRAFAIEFFKENVTEDEWTPELLVSLCDSIREPIQAYGREMITRNFKKEDGPEYLKCLCEHPSADMQIFAVNYIEKHASGNPEMLQTLQPLFTSVLSLINKGRVAKRRIYRFLENESLKSESAAKLALGLLERQSLTSTLRDKTECIQLMAKLSTVYPNLQSELQVEALPAGVTRA